MFFFRESCLLSLMVFIDLNYSPCLIYMNALPLGFLENSVLLAKLFLSKDVTMTALGDFITYMDMRPPLLVEFRDMLLSSFLRFNLPEYLECKVSAVPMRSVLLESLCLKKGMNLRVLDVTPRDSVAEEVSRSSRQGIIKRPVLFPWSIVYSVFVAYI